MHKDFTGHYSMILIAQNDNVTDQRSGNPISQKNRDAIRKYREISIRLADPILLSQLKSFFERRYNLKELLDWLHKTLKWDNGEITRHNDPMEIIAYRRGRCGEFSILFTSVCLAHNYRARLVLDLSDHVWTEVWNSQERRWVHVDPSEKRIDDPLMYERDWKKNLKGVYTFENGNLENVTKNYKTTCARGKNQTEKADRLSQIPQV
jgi:hypothetical protein